MHGLSAVAGVLKTNPEEIIAIKTCNKCNKEISGDARRCPHCGAPVWTKDRIGCASVLFIFLVLLSINLYISTADKNVSSNAPSKNIPAIKKYSSAERLKLASDCLAAGYKMNNDIVKSSWGNVKCAKGHLAAIKPDMPEYDEAQKLLKEVVRREAEIKKASLIVADIMMIEQREKFARNYENDLLSKGMDVVVTLSGKDKKIIKMKYILFNRPLVYKLIVEGKMLDSFDAMGFTKVILTDGYDSTWDFDINKLLHPKGDTKK